MNCSPFPTLQGERVRLRLATADDIPQIIAFYQVNAAHFETVASPKPASFYTPQFWLAKVKASQTDFKSDRSCNLFIFDLSDINILGFINLFGFIRGAFHACILGYGLAQSAQGKGLMSEALSLAIHYAFTKLNLHRIMANYNPTNERSGRLLRRLGFVVEGYAQNYLLVHGKWQDHVLTSLTNEQWQLQHSD